MKTTILETRGLTKTYAGVPAVDGVSLTLHKGDIYGFIGQNGAGKTTFIRLVTALIHPTAGDIKLFGMEGAKNFAEAHKRIGCIVEGPCFYPRLTARQNLEYYRIQRGLPDPTAVDEALKTVKLTDTGKKHFGQFSLGMKQRLGLALAIMAKPDLLILDEPINGLDPVGIIEFRGILQELSQKHGMTILVSSHILSELAQVATRFGIIHGGRLVKECTKEELEGYTRRSVTLKVSDTALAATVLERELNITKYEVLPDNELRVFEQLDDSGEITFQLSTNGVRVLSAVQNGEDLEAFYLKTIEQQEVPA